MDKPSMDVPTDLAALVEYQDDSIVSRVLARDSSGTVTAFAFAAGQGLSEHETPFDALLYVFDGSATVTVAGTAHRLAEGQIIRLPAHVPHAVEAAAGRFKMLLLMLRSK